MFSTTYVLHTLIHIDIIIFLLEDNPITRDYTRGIDKNGWILIISRFLNRYLKGQRRVCPIDDDNDDDGYLVCRWSEEKRRHTGENPRQQAATLASHPVSKEIWACSRYDERK